MLQPVPSDESYFLEFQKGLKLTGNLIDPCNICMGSYSIEADRSIQITSGGCTEMACSSPGSAPIHMLASAKFYAIRNRPCYGCIYKRQPQPELHLYYEDSLSGSKGVLVYKDEATTTGTLHSVSTLSQTRSLSLSVNPSPGAGILMVCSTREQAPVSLGIYDISGKLVRTLVTKESGVRTFAATWDGRDESGIMAQTGMYIARLQSGRQQVTAKVLLLQ